MNVMFNISSLLSGAGVFFGLAIIGGMVFAESGLLIGLFLPGDTLLLTVGVFAAEGKLPLTLTIAIIAIAAIIGDNLGYTIGRRLGRRIFSKEDGLIFRKDYIDRAEHFYERFGGKTMLISHSIAYVRTFAPLIAGIAKMNRLQFFIFDAIGDIAWAIVITLLGYWFGRRIPNIDHYIVPTIIIGTIFTFGPVIWHVSRDKKIRQKLHDRRDESGDHKSDNTKSD